MMLNGCIVALGICSGMETIINYRRKETYAYNGLFTLLGAGSATESDLDSKPDGYIVLCTACSHCMDLDSDPNPDTDHQLLLYTFLGRIFVPRLRSESVRQYK